MATEGQDVRIHCEASGQQPLHFQWFKKRQELHGQTANTLSLLNVSQENAGFYVCRIANQVGVLFTGWAKVIVNGNEGAFGCQQFGKYKQELFRLALNSGRLLLTRDQSFA